MENCSDQPLTAKSAVSATTFAGARPRAFPEDHPVPMVRDVPSLFKEGSLGIRADYWSNNLSQDQDATNLPAHFV